MDWEAPIDLALSATVLRLTMCSPRLFDLAGATAHALVLELISRGDPVLGERLRSQGTGKPYTVAALIEERLPGTILIRVTAVDAAIPRALTGGVALQQTRPLDLGGVPITDITLLVSSKQTPWAGASSVGRLIVEAGEPGDMMTIVLASPLLPARLPAGPSGEWPAYEQFTPERLFEAMHARWRVIEGLPTIRRAEVATAAAKAEVCSSRLTVATILRRYGAYEELRGVVGYVSLRLHGNAHERAILRALALASFYLGAGSGTTNGMGRVRTLMGAKARIGGLYE